MNLKEILAKDPATLSDEEKAFVKTNASKLSDEEKEKFADILDDEEKGMSVEEVKGLITASVQEALGKKVDEIATGIAKNFQAGAEKQRAKVLAGQEIKKDEHADSMTRKFMRAILDGDKAAAKALTTSESGSAPDDAQAGLLIPKELRAEIMRIAETQFGLARRDMFYLPFSGPGNSRTIPALGTSVSVNWTGEGAKKKSTQPKFSIVTQILKKLTAIVPMTEEILEDSAVNLTNLIGTLFAEAVAKEEDLQFFAGVGTPWTGILNNSSVNVVNEGDGAESGDTNANLADDLLAMQDATPSGALSGAKYYFHRTWLSKIRKLKDSTGQYIYQAPGANQPGTIWGYPYETSDAFPAKADVEAGDPFILFGNLKQSCVFGDKQQIRVKLLEEATVGEAGGDSDDEAINLAEQDMVALRLVERVGYVVALPKALTVLKKGAES